MKEYLETDERGAQHPQLPVPPGWPQISRHRPGISRQERDIASESASPLIFTAPHCPAVLPRPSSVLDFTITACQLCRQPYLISSVCRMAADYPPGCPVVLLPAYARSIAHPFLDLPGTLSTYAARAIDGSDPETRFISFRFLRIPHVGSSRFFSAVRWRSQRIGLRPGDIQRDLRSIPSARRRTGSPRCWRRFDRRHNP